MKNLMKSLSDYVNNRRTAKKILKIEEEKLEKYLIHLENLEEARTIFQTASQTTQTQLSNTIETIVSSALAAVFDDPYTFVVDFVSRRNVTECDLLFEKNGKRYSPLDSCGFGAADIASLALRVAYWNLDGSSRNCIVLDEPTRALSLDKHELSSMMIKELSKMPGGLQFIIVTHSESLAKYADKCFKVTKTNNISHVKEILNDNTY
jgi:DNA repair exonuclease SbcCD ATPase subunit